MVLQFGYWLTPVFWSLKMIPERYHFLVKLNPVYYITEGYRRSFIYKEWFWQHQTQTIYFWGVTILTLLLGLFVFSRLRDHFNDII